MALITCPDCQASISDAAPACPKCGRPMADAAPTASAPQTIVATRPGAPFEATGFVMILVGMGTAFASCGVGAFIGFIGFCVFVIGRLKG